jgi:hypothetical protein
MEVEWSVEESVLRFVAGCEPYYERFCISPIQIIRRAMLGGVPVPTAWRVLGLRMEEWPPAMEASCEYIEEVVADITRGGPPAWGLGVGLITPHHKKTCYEQFTQSSDLDGFFG